MIKKNKIENLNSIVYKFSFVSLICPYKPAKIYFNQKANLKNNLKKIFLKNSYIILSWLFYLSALKQTQVKYKKFNVSSLPKKKTIFTQTKAPIAHKNWSKEQYKFSYYRFNFKIKGSFDEFNKNSRVDIDFLSTNSLKLGVSNVLLMLLLTKNNFISFETNIFYLKNYNFLFSFKDFNFFNYFKI